MKFIHHIFLLTFIYCSFFINTPDEEDEDEEIEIVPPPHIGPPKKKHYIVFNIMDILGVNPREFVLTPIPMSLLLAFKLVILDFKITFIQTIITKHPVPHFHHFVKVIFITVDIGNGRRLEKVSVNSDCVYKGEDLSANEDGNTVDYDCGAATKYKADEVDGVLDENGDNITNKDKDKIYLIVFDKAEIDKPMKLSEKRSTSENEGNIILSGQAKDDKCPPGSKYTIDFEKPKKEDVECTLSDSCKIMTCPLIVKEGDEIELNDQIDTDQMFLKLKTSDGSNDSLKVGKINETRKKATSSKSSSLSGGAIAAIVIAGVVVVGLAIFGVIFFSSRGKAPIRQTEYSHKSLDNLPNNKIE